MFKHGLCQVVTWLQEPAVWGGASEVAPNFPLGHICHVHLQE